MQLAMAVSRSRKLQRELGTVDTREGRELTLPEAAQLPGWPSAREMGITLEQGAAARATLYERNMGLAHKGASSYYTHCGRSMPYPDLVQVCCAWPHQKWHSIVSGRMWQSCSQASRAEGLAYHHMHGASGA